MVGLLLVVTKPELDGGHLKARGICRIEKVALCLVRSKFYCSKSLISMVVMLPNYQSVTFDDTVVWGCHERMKQAFFGMPWPGLQVVHYAGGLMALNAR